MNPAEYFRPHILIGPILMTIVICANAASGMAVVSGRVTGSVSFEGKLISRALVVAVGVTPGSGQTSALTDAVGHYAINLTAASYFLTVVHSGYVVDDGGFGCSLVEIRSDASLTLDFTLVKGGVISGTVDDVLGKPLVGQRVLYEIVDKQFTKPCLVAGQEDARTDDQGAFRIFGLPTGKYRVSVAREEYRDIGKSAGSFRATYYPGVPDKTKAEIIEVSPGQERKLPTFSVATSTHAFSAEVTSIDQATGDALPGIDFDIVSVVNGASVNKTQMKTGVSGNVKIRNLDPGQYRILSPVRNSNSPLRDCSPLTFEIADRDLQDLTIKCGGDSVSISGRHNQ